MQVKALFHTHFSLAMKICCSAALMMSLFSASYAQATKVFVSAKTGLDGGPCDLNAPCRTFNFAQTQVSADGEINVIDSGDYAGFTMTKSLTVQAAAGVLATIEAPTLGAVGIAVDATITRLIARNLSFYGAGTGILVVGSANLHIEDCVFRDMNSGIDFQSSGRIYAKNLVTQKCITGLRVTNSAASAATARGVIEDCRFENGNIGLIVMAGAQVTARNSVATGNSDRGFAVVFATTGVPQLNLENCLAAHNNTGIRSNNTAIIRVSNCTVINNTTGISPTTGSIFSRGNNTVESNTINGVFTGTFTAK